MPITIKNLFRLSSLLFIFPLSVIADDNKSANASLTPEQLYSPLPADVVPELAENGQYSVGVKTISLVNKSQFDVSSQTTKDRKLTVEVWYPSSVNNESAPTSYNDVTRTGIPFSIQAQAYRNSPVINAKEKFPLVVLSHGYTGYRTLMFYIGEHLASHGYIVAAIDHTDSTNAEVDIKNNPFGGFVSTLLNRSRDQQFVLESLTSTNTFIGKAIDSERAGLIGYSMGGFGAVNTLGGCYNFTPETTAAFTGVSNPEQVSSLMALLNSCAGGQYKDVHVDTKWKAAVAMAPWGGQHALFNSEALQNITTPILYVSGNLDDVSGYEGIKSLFKQTGSQSKYLLTYQNARHNIAPHPAPAVAKGNELDIGHYYEPSWSSIVLNNTNKHFSLAMMNCHVKQQAEQCKYLELSSDSNQLTQGKERAKPWLGFDHRYSTGMQWQAGK